MVLNVEKLIKVSICIPVYNGAKTIADLVEEVFEELGSEYNLEIILVNDCSLDNSGEVCKNLATENQSIKYICLRKNFGEHNAVMCCLNYCTGDYVAIIDDDFQNPPSEIIKLVEEARKGYDVVYSQFEKKSHYLFRNLGSTFSNKVSNWLLDKPSDLYLSSFKVIKKDLVEEIIKYTGPAPYIDGLVLRATKNISSIYVVHDKRREGQSNYTLRKLISLWLNMFINFSIKPLRIFSMFGIVVTLVSFIASLVFLIQKLIDPTLQIGWTSIMTAILFFAGVQIVFLGLISEYIGKHYLQANMTPQWTIKEKSF